MFDDRQPLDIYDTHAVRLVQHGYHPIPIAPFGSETKKCPVKWAPDVMRFFGFPNWNTSDPLMTTQPGANIGALMGKGVIALDYDNDDAALIISDALPPSPVNKAGARAFTAFYRVDFDVRSQDFWNDDGELVLQILSWGKQTVIPPSIHADTGEPYRWTNGHSLYDTPIEQLPLLPRDYVERITGLGFKAERPGGARADRRNRGEALEGPHADLNRVAIENLEKWVPQLPIHGLRRIGRRFPTYEGVAQWREGTTGKPLEQRAPNLKISSKGIKDFGDGRGYSALDLVMAARQSSLGEAFAWLEEKLLPQKEEIEIDLDQIVATQEREALTLEDAPKMVPEGDNGDGPEKPKTEDNGTRVYGRIRLIPYDAVPPEKLKRRLWLYRRHYLGGTVSSTVGDSGIGKTSLSLIEIVGLSVGRDLLGDEKLVPHRCWYHNGEDTRDEINLRLGAICEYYRLNQTEVRKNLLITCGLDMPVEVAKGSPPTIDKHLVQNIADAIVGEGTQVAVFDPLITMHQVNENGVEIRTVLRNVFANVANFTGCAIELPHHTRKLFPGVEEASADDARGSTEIKAAVRGMRMASGMTKAEAELYQISEADRLAYFKTYSVKANMTRKGNVFWYKIESHELPNGVPEQDIPGEAVGVVTRWEPPNQFDPLMLYTLEDKKHWFELSKSGGHRYDQRSQNWFGYHIAERLKLKARTNSEHKRRAAAVVEALIEEGVLAVESCADVGRRVVWIVAGKPTWEDTPNG